MIKAGIDAGVAYTKVVIMKDGTVAGKGTGPTGGLDRNEMIRETYEAALRDAGLTADKIDEVIATGKGRFSVSFADRRISEQLAAAKAAMSLCPGATCVVSTGADETTVSVLAGDGLLGEYAFNQKCTAGLGLFLEYMADRLGMSLDELGKLESTGQAAVNEGCVVFAELDALTLLNHGVPAAEVGKALNMAAAARVNSVINDITKPSTERTVLIGGLTANAAFVKALEKLSGIKFTIPSDAQYAGAIGAASTTAHTRPL